MDPTGHEPDETDPDWSDYSDKEAKWGPGSRGSNDNNWDNQFALGRAQKFVEDARKNKNVVEELIIALYLTKKIPKIRSLLKPSKIKGKVNPKIYNNLKKQLETNGAKSIKKAHKTAKKTLEKHVKKLPNLKYKSQVETTIRNVQNQIKTLEKFMNDHNIPF